jgi:hypothetical protein
MWMSWSEAWTRLSENLKTPKHTINTYEWKGAPAIENHFNALQTKKLVRFIYRRFYCNISCSPGRPTLFELGIEMRAVIPRPTWPPLWMSVKTKTASVIPTATIKNQRATPYTKATGADRCNRWDGAAQIFVFSAGWITVCLRNEFQPRVEDGFATTICLAI